MSDDRKQNGAVSNNKVPLTPPLVHRIMLSPPEEFPLLTMDGHPRSETLFFQSFLKQEGFTTTVGQNTESGGEGEEESQQHSMSLMSIPDQIAHTMKRAFHANILEQISSSQSYEPLCPLILEIHEQLRSLIPNRTDLHSILDDDLVKRICLPKKDVTSSANDDVDGDDTPNVSEESAGSNLNLFHQMLQVLHKIGEALAMLESEDRTVSTVEWMKVSTALMTSAVDENVGGGSNNVDSNITQLSNFGIQWDDPPPTQKEWIMASTSFIHRKAEQCLTDIQNFQLAHVVAPTVFENFVGRDFERREFEIRFAQGFTSGGSRSGKVILSTPHLETWLKELVQTCGYENLILMTSERMRREALLKTGWVDNILFRSPRQMGVEHAGENLPFYMPEIFHLDVMSLQAIRMTAKVSVVGSVLALHASNIAGVSESVYRQDPLDARIDECRMNLAKAMGNKAVGSQELFERGVGDAVIDLVRALNPDLPESSEDTVRSRCVATMSGEDPVIKLLDNRMRDIFREMIVLHPQSSSNGIPSSIRSGLGGRRLPSHEAGFSTIIQKTSKEEFMKKGFSFYAKELAETTLMASRIINLALYVHGPIVDKMFLDICLNLQN